jgi:hypothetical protein
VPLFPPIIVIALRRTISGKVLVDNRRESDPATNAGLITNDELPSEVSVDFPRAARLRAESSYAVSRRRHPLSVSLFCGYYLATVFARLDFFPVLGMPTMTLHIIIYNSL